MENNPMTVGDLIKELKKYDPKLEIVLRDTRPDIEDRDTNWWYENIESLGTGLWGSQNVLWINISRSVI